VFPSLGVGLGYRPQLHDDIMRAPDRIGWLELIAENFLPLSPRRQDLLAEITRTFTCALHCTELSLGSGLPVDPRVLAQVAELAEIVDALWVSDHFCFTTAGGVHLGHLTPVQWTWTNARNMADNASTVIREVGRPFLLENIAYPFVIPGQLIEAEFITAVLEESGSYLLLDVANVFANATNFGFDPYQRIDAFPLSRLGQVHVAGGAWDGGFLADSHDAPVPDEVWRLLRHVASCTPIPSVLLERDAAFPDDFGEILGELQLARTTAYPAGPPLPSEAR
jgi:uncharacterized protein (UPF0276 family)